MRESLVGFHWLTSRIFPLFSSVEKQIPFNDYVEDEGMFWLNSDGENSKWLETDFEFRGFELIKIKKRQPEAKR